MRPLAQIIHADIAECGPIPFNRFMELALYCPEYGFYETEADKVGRQGDFYTSVNVGPLFGALVAFQFSRWFEKSKAAQLQLVEAGAHDGKLASDVLGWFRNLRPELFAELKYCILEPSLRRREWQKRTLSGFAGNVRWASDWVELRNSTSDGFTVVFSNELLDAMPVRRFGWDAKEHEWFEWGVGVEGDRCVWKRLKGADALAVRHLPSSPELLAVLPDGYIVEASPAAEQWWQQAAQHLSHGKLLTFDYGFGAADALLPERTGGTLRAYRDHKLADDILADPGEQDITAHVNFPRMESLGVAAGLVTESFETQGRYLTQIAAEAWKADSGFGTWDQKSTRQFQTLTHPEHLGRSFRVLVQSRGCNS